MNQFVISIGSNISPEANIGKAIDELRKVIKVKQVSQLITTTPIGITDQADFVNGALNGESGLSMNELNIQLKKVEDKLGRDRTRPKFGPREIDLDIVVWNSKIVDNDYYSHEFLKTVVDQVK